MAYRKPLKELRADTEAAIKERNNPTKNTLRPAMRAYHEEKNATLNRMAELRNERLKQAGNASRDDNGN